MRRTFVVAPVATVLAMAGLYWLMLHGFLELTAWLLVVAVLTMVGAAVWEFRNGHRKGPVILLAGAVVTATVVGAYGWNLNSKLDNIQRADDHVLTQGSRPKKVKSEAVNILLMGADNPNQLEHKPTVAQLLADGKWDPGAYRSDSMMVVHLPADRKSAYVVSVPRDSYVPIYDGEGVKHGKNKINEAFSQYGPFGTLRTIEKLSDLRIDHLAVIDFEGFRDLTTAVGGVDVYVPVAFYDSKQKVEWEQGINHLEGVKALQYVRTRHGLANGDFDRVDRQQNFLRALMGKVLEDGTIGNPVRFTDTLDAITKNLTVDASWKSSDIRGLALSMRDLESKKVRFMTLPLDHYQTVPDAGSVNIIAAQRAHRLWDAVENDKVGRYLKANPADELPDPKDVS
jgi:LCP family protein required for cell wall assembly